MRAASDAVDMARSTIQRVSNLKNINEYNSLKINHI
jgi:hypothetical protein